MDILEGNEWGYDPAYVGEEQDSEESNHPVDVDDWAKGDFDGE